LLSEANHFIRRPQAGNILHPLTKAAVALFFAVLFLGVILMTGGSSRHGVSSASETHADGTDRNAAAQPTTEMAHPSGQ
jgi:hypothetical protein